MDALLASPNWSFFVLLLGIISVVVMISVLRFNAFIALILTAIFVGLITPDLPTGPGSPKPLHIITAIELPMQEFGTTAGKIAWVIALAAIIGTAMMASGAAEKIVNWLLQVLKEKRAATALLISGFILSIPVFFDTVFFLLIPLAIALALKTKRNYVLYVVAIGAGAAITHSIVPPTPGPLIMAENMHLDVGLTILAGLGLGILPTVISLFWAKRLNRKMEIPVRVELENTENNGQLPSLILSLLPVIMPIILISIASIAEVQLGKGNVPALIAFIGEIKNIAMAVGTVIALWLWAKQRNLPIANYGKPLVNRWKS
ncbi:MAG: SLC13 family permease [Bacteroidia bacterium]